MHIANLTASTALGGPERQMLGLAHTLREQCQTSFISFPEGGRCAALLDAARRAGFGAHDILNDTPHLLRAARDLTDLLHDLRPDVLCCQGYKADLLGLWVARRLKIPVVAVARGWTWENAKVRAYEAIDRYVLRWMDRVVCVSQAQARRVADAGVSAKKICLIRNAIQAERFANVDAGGRARLQRFFPSPRQRIVGAAGRLSPEKGVDVFIRAAARIAAHDPEVGFVIFGEGTLRDALAEQVRRAGLENTVVMPGFQRDLDHLVPHLDVSVLASYTEGLPNVVLEAMAGGVPVVATAVGGTPEVVIDGFTGHLVPAGDAATLAQRIQELLTNDTQRREMGRRGRERVATHFTFAAQARDYLALFREVKAGGGPRLGVGEWVRLALRRSRVARPLVEGKE